MQFESQIKASVAAALKQLYDHEIQPDNITLAETKKDFEGDTTLVVFPFTKISKKSPEETADDIGQYLFANAGIVSSFNVVKGFLNIIIRQQAWKQFFAETTQDSSNYLNLHRLSPVPHNLMVEYSSPNTNKPLHLGHIRNNLIGFSIAEILQAVGNKVVRVNLVNDRGVHICKSMLAWMKYGNGETPESSGMKGDHLVGKYYVEFDRRFREEVKALMEEKDLTREEAEKKSPLMQGVQDMLRKWEDGDEETIALWKKMNGWVYEGFEQTYNDLGIRFDKIYYESQTYLYGKKIIEEGLAKHIFYKKEDGSVWVDLTDAGLDQKLLLRGDGTAVYITQDLGTAQLRYDEFADLEQLIYVVGNEQDYHFKVLRQIFKKLGRPWAEGLYHLSYGMVDLPSGKMKSREGTVVDADDLIAEINKETEATTKSLGKLDDYDSAEARQLYHHLAMGALKYFILKVDPKKRMLFNPAESIDLNGNTGPFIQYTHARIRSVIRKAEQSSFVNKRWTMNEKIFSKEEKNLLKVIYNYPEAVSKAASMLDPAMVANYVYELAKAYNQFYHDHIIVSESQPEVSLFRLELSKMTATLIHECLRLLGITAPERM